MNSFTKALNKLAGYVVLGIAVIGVTGLVVHSMTVDNKAMAIDYQAAVETITPVEVPIIIPTPMPATDVLAEAAKIVESQSAGPVEEILPPEDIPIEEEEDFKYKVQSGDSMWAMANKFYGNGNLHGVLKAYNFPNTNRISLHPGDIIKIPSVLSGIESVYAGQNDLVKELNAALDAINPLATPPNDISNPLRGSVTSNGDVLEVFQQVVTYVEDTSNMEYIGDHFITGYTPTCAHCCGKSNAITASGALATIDRTVAMSGLEFGTEVYIEGYGFYVVEDRGVGEGVVDIARLTHEDCGIVTKHNIPVYIVK